MPNTELFLGGLSKDTRRQDLEDVFGRYGKLTRCDIKHPSGKYDHLSSVSLYTMDTRLYYCCCWYIQGIGGSSFGFIAFEDDRDAEVTYCTFFHLSFCHISTDACSYVVVVSLLLLLY